MDVLGLAVRDDGLILEDAAEDDQHGLGDAQVLRREDAVVPQLHHHLEHQPLDHDEERGRRERVLRRRLRQQGVRRKERVLGVRQPLQQEQPRVQELPSAHQQAVGAQRLLASTFGGDL